MNSKPRHVSNNSQVLTVRYRDDNYYFGVYRDGRFVERSIAIRKLEQGLLPALLKGLGSQGDVAAIILDRFSYGGFVTSRLVAATLNAIAWQKNIPIFLHQIGVMKTEALISLIQRFVSARSAFFHIAIPVTDAYPITNHRRGRLYRFATK